MLYGVGEEEEVVSGVKVSDVKSKREGNPVREMNMGVLMEPSLSSPPDVQLLNDASEIFNSSFSPTLTSITLPLPSFLLMEVNCVL